MRYYKFLTDLIYNDCRRVNYEVRFEVVVSSGGGTVYVIKPYAYG